MAMVKCKECGAEMSSKAKQCPNCGKRRMGIGAIIGIVIAALIVLSGFSACVSGGSSDSNANEQQQNTSNTSEGNISVAQNEQVSNPDNLKIKSAKFDTSSIGDKIIYVTYEWTNNDDEKRSFGYTYSAKAYQDGVEISETVFGDNEPNEDLNDVKSGVTQTFTEAYELKNSKDAVDIEITKWLFDDDEVIVSKSFKIE